MLLCSDNTYYTGITNNLYRRLYEHKTGYNKGSYTSRRLPVKLVYVAIFRDVREAISWEKKIKKWSQRKKKALIEGDWGRVSSFSTGSK